MEKSGNFVSPEKWEPCLRTSVKQTNRTSRRCCILTSGGSRIFLRWGRQLPKFVLFYKFLSENCMKMKEFGPSGVRVPGAPLDPPMLTLLINKLADWPPSCHIPARIFSQMIEIFCTSSFDEQADSKQASNYTRNMKLSYSDRYMDILWYWPLESKFSWKRFVITRPNEKRFCFCRDGQRH